MVGEEKKKDLEKVRTDMEVNAELDFLLDDYAKKKSLIEQDKKAVQVMEREGKDPRDSFRVVGIKNREGERPELQIITSGEEGYDRAKETLSAMKERKYISVVNETSRRYERDSPDLLEKHIEKRIEEKLREDRIRRIENGEV